MAPAPTIPAISILIGILPRPNWPIKSCCRFCPTSLDWCWKVRPIRLCTRRILCPGFVGHHLSSGSAFLGTASGRSSWQSEGATRRHRRSRAGTGEHPHRDLSSAAARRHRSCQSPGAAAGKRGYQPPPRRAGRGQRCGQDLFEAGIDRRSMAPKAIPTVSMHLERLLDDQAYRLSFWRVASDEINYRRFFDINDLAAIRVENPEVFATVHRIPFELIQKVAGVRNSRRPPRRPVRPARIFRGPSGSGAAAGRSIATGSANGVRRRICTSPRKRFWSGMKNCGQTWAIEGTTGYGFLNLLNGLFVDASRKARSFSVCTGKFTGWSQSYADLIYESKRLVMQVSMSSELNVLSRRLDRISEQHRRSRDFTLESLRDALREVIACFPCTGPIFASDTQHPDEQDERNIRSAIKAAKRRNPATSGRFSISFRICFCSKIRTASAMPTAPNAVCSSCAFSSSPARSWPRVWRTRRSIATVRCYRSMKSADRLTTFGVALTALSCEKPRRADQSWRNAMLASSTHDTKRSEDVRARINVLSEIPCGMVSRHPRLAALESRRRKFRWPARTFPARTRNISCIRLCSAPGP